MKKIIGVLALTIVVLSFVSITSCKKDVKGCTDPNAANYNSSATVNDGSCIAKTTTITVWTSLSTFPCSTALINVYIDDIYRGSISSYYTSTPSCGASGGVSYNVTAGSHKIYAQCSSGTTTWGPFYRDISGSCYTFQLY